MAKPFWEQRLTYSQREDRRRAFLFDAVRHCLDCAAKLSWRNRAPEKHAFIQAAKILRATRWPQPSKG